MDIRILESIDQCLAADWDQLFDTNYPFTQHRFLSLLETSGSVSTKTGWEPQHLLLEHNGKPIAAIPLYLKYHSWGEYVFDHSWANAYADHNIAYYPKLLTAIPFTPATGPRIGLDKNWDNTELIKQLINAVSAHADEVSASSWHLLFPEQQLATTLQQQGTMQRSGVQYHWHNNNYHSFDEFIATFTSRQRKNVLKERRAANQTLHIHHLVGEQITPEWWDFFQVMYQRTYLKRNGTGGYLTHSFFQQLGATMQGQLMMCVAEDSSQSTKPSSKVAAALFFFDNQTLYGRYWGCQQEYDFLHFELCYYRGIEFAIELGLTQFNAGAQGEHKIKRGFTPVETYSSHWIKDNRFADAIEYFLEQEKEYIQQYIYQANELLPFKARDP